jgi:hypothetical protein
VNIARLPRLRTSQMRLKASSTALALLLVVTVESNAQELAYVRSQAEVGTVRSGAQGNAWLFSRGNECFAALPKHVLIDPATGRNDRYARVVVVRPGREPREAQGDRCAVWPDKDLALLHVSGVPDLHDCGRVLSGVANIDLLLGATTQVSLETATDSGRLERSTLEIRSAGKDPDHFWVAPSTDRDRLGEGMSGGLVTVHDELAGFLLAVGIAADGPMAGMARVLRADRAALLIARALDRTGEMAGGENTCVSTARHERMSDEGHASGAPDLNRASASCGANVVGWGSPPVSPSVRPENLVGTAGPAGHWRTLTTVETTVDVRLCPTPSTVTIIRFDTSGCDPGDNLDLEFEVAIRVAPNSASTTLGYGRLRSGGDTEVTSGEALVADQVRLRFVAHGNSRHVLCLAPLIVR